MAKTLLQLTNEVGKNLRRSDGTTYTSITQNADVIFIVQAINEAKRMVEDDWESDLLNTEVTFDSVASTHTYDTSSLSVISSATVTTDRSHILRNKRDYRMQFWDVTDAEFRVLECSREFAENAQVMDTTDQGKPGRVAVYPNANGLTVHFPYAPSGVRSYKFKAKIPQDDLVLAATELTVPWRPVVLAATALAVEERGEELGLDSSRWWEQYEKAYGSMVSRESYEGDMQLVPDTYDYMNPW